MGDIIAAARRSTRTTLASGALLFCCAAGAPLPAAAQTAGASTEVFVLATLYRRHADIPAYSHDTLRALIERVRPVATVLDVSPRELREERVHPSKAEYPQVIFPLVRAHGYRAYPGEPDEPEFTQVVSQLGQRLKAFRTEQPEAAGVDEAYEKATFAALYQLWRTPADVNGALTDRLVTARREFQDRVAGPEVAGAWRRWNEHAVAAVQRAVREHPGRRVLVLIGVENAAAIRASLQRQPGIQLVDVETWLASGVP